MEPGHKINDRYEIIRLLGEGGMGNVYLVKDFVESRTIALKLIKEKFFSNKAIDRFKNEFKLVSQLKHPNIVKVYDLDVYHETDTYFFTMEYVEGEDLTQAYPKLSYNEKLEVLLQIARGLNYIHNRHIIHFDIKTDNIFLIRDGESFKAKIMDFGLANFKEDFSGKVRGTLVYIAPEVLMKKEIDYRVDLYSLGMVIYYIFSGKLPFEECKTVKEIVKKKIEESFREEEAFKNISENFVKNLIKDLCAARKEERINTAQQLILYLETALELNIKEEEERIETTFNNEYYDKDGILSDLQDEYLNFRLRTDKMTGMLSTVISENGNGKTQLLEALNVKAQLTRVQTLYLKIEKEESSINIFFRKLIFGLIGFLEKNDENKNIFISANELIDNDGFFIQDKDIVYKVRSVIKKIFDSLSKQTLMLLVDDVTSLDEPGKDLFTYVLNLAVTSPIFFLLSIDIDLVENNNCRIKEYESIYYIIPPKRYYIENLNEDEALEYIAFLLNESPDKIDREIVPYVMKESNGNMSLIKSYLEFLISHKYFNKKGEEYEFIFPDNIKYHSKIIDIYQARFANLSRNEKFVFLYISGKFDKGANYEKIKRIFDIEDIDEIMNKLQRMSLIDFTIRRGDKYYFIKNENFTKVIQTVSKQDRQKFYDKLTTYYGKKKKRSLITYTYCLIKSSSEGKVKKKQLKETIEYCKKRNLNIDRKNFLIYYYKSFKITSKTRTKILHDLYLLLISMGSFDQAFIYYSELLKKIKLPKTSVEYAQILADSICFTRSQVSLHDKSGNLKKAAVIMISKGNITEYLNIFFKRLTFLTRIGRIKICPDIIKHEISKNGKNLDSETVTLLKNTGIFFKNAKHIQRSEIYLKLVHIYKYLEADFVYPDETLDLPLILIFDQLISQKNLTALNLNETFLINPGHGLNKVEGVSLRYLYANLLKKAGKLRKSYEVFKQIEQLSVKKTVGNNLLTVLSDKVEVMSNMRKTAYKVDIEFQKAISLGKRFKDYLGLFRIYVKYMYFLIGTGRWRDTEINMRFGMNLIHKINNKDEIKRFLIAVAYYHYVIKDSDGYNIYSDSILKLHPEIKSSSSITGIRDQLSMLFRMYSSENSQKLLDDIPDVKNKIIKFLMVMKFFNNTLNNYDKESIELIKDHVVRLKKVFGEFPYLKDYLSVIENLIHQDYVNALKVTVKLGKENYGKGYIFDSYFAILSSYFYFKNKSLYRNAEFFEEKLSKLSSKLISGIPVERKESFENKYWVI